MVSFKVTITDPIGLHARPASKLVQTAGKFQSNISLKLAGKRANVKSIMNLMALGVKTGTEVEFEIDGVDEKAAEAALKVTIKENDIA